MEDGGDQKSPKGQEEGGTWNYRPEGGAGALDAPAPAPAPDGLTPDDTVQWTASEFIAHSKNSMWYIVFAVVVVAVAAGLYLVTRDIVTIVVVVILAAIFATAASRKPRVMTYQLDRSGITLGKHFIPYGKFKSFAVVDEDAFSSITFLPLQRLSFPTSIYFAPEDEKKIMSVLSRHLPVESGGLGVLEELMRSIHF